MGINGVTVDARRREERKRRRERIKVKSEKGKGRREIEERTRKIRAKERERGPENVREGRTDIRVRTDMLQKQNLQETTITEPFLCVQDLSCLK